ncbi:MAG: molybdopterin-dependent oxidoreductase, partial [Chloroflexota bacterium]
MPREFLLEVNSQTQRVVCEPDTPLLYVLRNDLGLKGVKYGCGSEQCGACKALVDGQAVPTCKLPVKDVTGLSITTVEGLIQGSKLHPLQEAFIQEQALQCGFCTPGMIIAAQGLLNHQRYPSDEDIRTALETNLCRCGVYDRVRRAIKLRIGRPDQRSKYAVQSDLESLAKFSSPQLPAPLPHTLVENPDLDDWIRLNADGTITLFTGKVELGQGIKTAVALIGAEELDVSLERIKVTATDTAHSPNEGLTVGSMSLETTGEAMRFAAAEARQVLLSIAFEELEAPIDRLVIADGRIHDPISGRSKTYWDLLGGQAFGRQVTGIGLTKSPDRFTLLGNANPRLDLPDKVSGAQIYIHDLDLPGKVHGRVLRPPHYAARLVSFDERPLKQIPGMIRIVQDGSFVGVICEREEQAIKALEQLQKSATWSGELNLPDQTSLFEHMLEQPKQSYLVQAGTPVEGVIPQIEIPSEAAHTLKSTYYRPFQMHASLGPSAAVAQLEDGELTLWVQSQGVYPIRAAAAHVLGMSENDVRVIHVEGAGCYGHNGADDAALDAALLARAYPGRPVSLKWMRTDEHTWEPYGPAMVMKMQASLGDDGQV